MCCCKADRSWPWETYINMRTHTQTQTQIVRRQDPNILILRRGPCLGLPSSSPFFSVVVFLLLLSSLLKLYFSNYISSFKSDHHLVHVKVVLCLVGHQLIVLLLSLLCFLVGNHLGLLGLHLLIFRNRFWLAIDIQDKGRIRFWGQECAILHPGKGEAGAAAVGEREAAAKAAVGTAVAAAGATTAAAAAGLTSRGESQGEESEEEAEDRGCNTQVHIEIQVSGPDLVWWSGNPIIKVCHAYAIDNMTQRRQEKMGEKMTKGSSALSSFSPSSSSSSPSSLGLLLHHFVLEAKVKWVKVGKRTMEGWEMTVLRMPRCQQETRPSSKPGRNIVAKIVASTCTLCSAGTL